MNQESNLPYLPPEILTNILSRLSIKTIITCKLVCKPWLQLLKAPAFALSHLSKSLPGLAIYVSTPHPKLIFFQLHDDPDLKTHDLHYDPVTEIDHGSFISPSHRSICIEGSANGLLFLLEVNTLPNVYYICNPITRDYIQVQSQERFSYPTIVTHGFGVSKTSGEFKLVKVVHERTLDNDTNALLGIPKSECHVYTLGTRSWRKITHDHAKFVYDCRASGAFLNGNLHWLVVDLEGAYWVSCFDLETELFHTFSLPCNVLPDRSTFLGGLFVLGDRLCLCDNTSEDEIVIWLMGEYGDEKSWTKEYIMSKQPDFSGECYEVVRPMKVFGDRDVLMAWDDHFLFYYSERAKVARSIDMFGPYFSMDSFLHTPSFISLMNFPFENPMSF